MGCVFLSAYSFAALVQPEFEISHTGIANNPLVNHLNNEMPLIWIS